MLLPCDYGLVLSTFLLRRHFGRHENSALCSLPQVLVGDMQSPAFFNREAPALAPYLDNATLIAVHPGIRCQSVYCSGRGAQIESVRSS